MTQVKDLKRLERIKEYPIRTYIFPICELCGKKIEGGKAYYDGGPGKTSHVFCVRAREFLR